MELLNTITDNCLSMARAYFPHGGTIWREASNRGDIFSSNLNGSA
jgi:hypothetical protein